MAVPLIIAHRGASADKPENTLAAFRRALDLQVDGIELDVHVTRDGVPVVFHDASLRRLTGQPGRIADRTWRALQKLRIHDREPIPRLAEVLALVRGRAVVQIELKRGAKVAPVIRVIQRARAVEWVVLSSFEPALLRLAAQIYPALGRLLIAVGRDGTETLLRQMAAAHAGGLSLNFQALRSRAMVGQIQRHGVPLWCWTVNDLATARRLAAWGVDALVGDNPALLKDLV